MDNASEAALRQLSGFRELQTFKESRFRRADLDQWVLRDLSVALRNTFGIGLQDVTDFILYFPCESFSYSSKASTTEHRTLEGAPKSHLAQFHTALLEKMIRDFVLPLHELNPRIRLYIENPLHGSFRYCGTVQRLVEQGWHIFRMDHCASAHPELDGPVEITTGTEVETGYFPLKGTAWLLPPRFNPYEVTLPPTCSRTKVCEMKIPGQNRHLRVICSSDKLHHRQQTVSGRDKSKVPLGALLHLLMRYGQIDILEDSHGCYCERCGDGGDGLQLCATEGCRRVQHVQCCPTDESANFAWVCDRCTEENLRVADQTVEGMLPGGVLELQAAGAAEIPEAVQVVSLCGGEQEMPAQTEEATAGGQQVVAQSSGFSSSEDSDGEIPTWRLEEMLATSIETVWSEAMLGRIMQLTTAQMTDRQRLVRDAERDRQKAADMLREHALRWGAGAAREADNVSDGRGTEKPPDKPD